MCGKAGVIFPSGLCAYPCDLLYGRSFSFFALDELCPVCLSQPEQFMKYPCGHLICPKCFSPTFVQYTNPPEERDFSSHAHWREAIAQWVSNEPYTAQMDHMDLMAKCPMCRMAGVPI